MLHQSSLLFVYDALVIRYNATASAAQPAGQPLHRDLGIVSINVMLNEEFEGGGTFFENQLLNDNKALHGPLQPKGGAGHCLAHSSSQRHAGAGTVSGVRDILVFFVTTAAPSALIFNARLKQCRDVCCCDGKNSSLLCRIRHHRLALRYVPDDGEAFQYLGTALLEYADYHGDDNALQAAIACFRRAERLTPCDARVYNNLGISLGKLEQKQQLVEQQGSAEEAYQKGLDILLKCQIAGCNVEHDLDSLSLNYGLYLAKQDRFAESYKILSRPAAKRKQLQDSRTIQDAYRLWTFCERNM